MTEPRKEFADRPLRENDEYRRLREEHAGFEERLNALHEKPFLCDSEIQEIAEIKKKKLILKDRMLELSNTLIAS